MILQQKHAEFGNRWAEIARFLPGRTGNDSKVRREGGQEGGREGGREGCERRKRPCSRSPRSLGIGGRKLRSFCQGRRIMRSR